MPTLIPQPNGTVLWDYDVPEKPEKPTKTAAEKSEKKES